MTVDYKNQIEALLFASGRFMDIDSLLSLTGVSGKDVLINNITKLKEEYEARGSPFMIVEEKNGWKLTVREPYLPLVRKIVSETELPKTILETLAVIAWKSPVLQSEVVDIRHNKAYDHISELQELGFIKKEQKGRSYLIKLTEKFYDYFDVEGTKDIREVFSRVVGVQPAESQTLLLQQAQPQQETAGQQQTEQEQTLPIPEPEPVEEFSELDEMTSPAEHHEEDKEEQKP
jgi:segregation and condensation protein B